MRNYLYIWHNPKQQFLLASGIEFKDFLPYLSGRGGAVLLSHQSDFAQSDSLTGLNYSAAPDLTAVASENIHSWGNFVWADYDTLQFPSISDDEVAELLFFAHKARPLRKIAIEGLQNTLIAYAHDDGWYLRLYYSSWSHIEELLATMVPASLGKLSVSALLEGKSAFWLSGGNVVTEAQTEDVDAVLARHM